MTQVSQENPVREKLFFSHGGDSLSREILFFPGNLFPPSEISRETEMAGTRASGRLPAPPVPQLKPTTVLLCNNAQIQNTEYKNTNVQIQVHKLHSPVCHLTIESHGS